MFVDSFLFDKDIVRDYDFLQYKRQAVVHCVGC